MYDKTGIHFGSGHKVISEIITAIQRNPEIKRVFVEPHELDQIRNEICWHTGKLVHPLEITIMERPVTTRINLPPLAEYLTTGAERWPYEPNVPVPRAVRYPHSSYIGPSVIEEIMAAVLRNPNINRVIVESEEYERIQTEVFWMTGRRDRPMEIKIMDRPVLTRLPKAPF
jgi:hypothetical protein